MSDTSKLTKLGSDTTYLYDKPTSATLETFDYTGDNLGSGTPLQIVGFKTDEFTSLCPKTGQPDFADIEILYVPNKLGVESKSLKLYLFSFRNHGSFHEDCITQITEDIIDTIDPLYIRVVGDFTRRGGIAIKPVTHWMNPLANEQAVYTLVQQYDRLHFNR